VEVNIYGANEKGKGELVILLYRLLFY